MDQRKRDAAIECPLLELDPTGLPAGSALTVVERALTPDRWVAQTLSGCGVPFALEGFVFRPVSTGDQAERRLGCGQPVRFVFGARGLILDVEG